jgi:hypothetical protein
MATKEMPHTIVYSFAGREKIRTGMEEMKGMKENTKRIPAVIPSIPFILVE